MTLSQDAIAYILSFLLYGNEKAKQQIVYSTDPMSVPHRVRIIPISSSLESLPLPNLDPVRVEQADGEIIIHTDLIYNTFFFISRAEECINPQRDIHGRFLAKYSILGQYNRLQIPLVDEYARLLMKWMDLPMPVSHFSHICLTHDIDTLEQYRHLRGLVGGIARGEVASVVKSLCSLHNDPAYTFPWLIQQDAQVPNAEVIYFVKDTQGKGPDYPQYNIQGKGWKQTQDLLLKNGAKIGLHSSYYGFYGHSAYSAHRSHYLKCDIDNMQRIADSGTITDDYTMGFPDQAGFRLQTTRPVRWINPKTGELTQLTLHPLTVMDCTLSNSDYMNLNEDEAFFFCERLFDKVKQNAGELVLLWHNWSPAGNSYQFTLYPKLLELIDE